MRAHNKAGFIIKLYDGEREALPMQYSNTSRIFGAAKRGDKETVVRLLTKAPADPDLLVPAFTGATEGGKVAIMSLVWKEAHRLKQEMILYKKFVYALHWAAERHHLPALQKLLSWAESAQKKEQKEHGWYNNNNDVFITYDQAFSQALQAHYFNEAHRLWLLAPAKGRIGILESIYVKHDYYDYISGYGLRTIARDDNLPAVKLFLTYCGDNQELLNKALVVLKQNFSSKANQKLVDNYPHSSLHRDVTNIQTLMKHGVTKDFFEALEVAKQWANPDTHSLILAKIKTMKTFIKAGINGHLSAACVSQLMPGPELSPNTYRYLRNGWLSSKESYARHGLNFGRKLSAVLIKHIFSFLDQGVETITPVTQAEVQASVASSIQLSSSHTFASSEQPGIGSWVERTGASSNAAESTRGLGPNTNSRSK